MLWQDGWSIATHHVKVTTKQMQGIDKEGKYIGFQGVQNRRFTL